VYNEPVSQKLYETYDGAYTMGDHHVEMLQVFETGDFLIQ
jgi:hypothetical protein